MYKVMLRIFKRVDMSYENYEKQAANNAELKTLLQEEKEDKHRLQLQLQATTEALDELKRSNKILQADHEASKALLQEEKEEKQQLQL